jgi:hypothetical protein
MPIGDMTERTLAASTVTVAEICACSEAFAHALQLATRITKQVLFESIFKISAPILSAENTHTPFK